MNTNMVMRKTIYSK